MLRVAEVKPYQVPEGLRGRLDLPLPLGPPLLAWLYHEVEGGEA